MSVGVSTTVSGGCKINLGGVKNVEPVSADSVAAISLQSLIKLWTSRWSCYFLQLLSGVSMSCLRWFLAL